MRNSILLIMCLFVSFTAFSQTFTSMANGNWNDTATWGGDNPPGIDNAGNGSAVDIVIAHNVTCTDTRTIGALTVNAGATLTVSNSGKFTVNSTVTDNGTILIQATENVSGSFIAKSATSVNISVEIFVPGTDGSTPDNWKLVGIPVNGETVGDIDDNLASNGSKVGIGRYISASNSWSLYTTADASTVLASNVGYEMLHASGGNVTFTGSMITGTRNSLESIENRWQLLGNPYPSYLRLSSGATGASANSGNFFLDTSNKSKLNASFQAAYAWDGNAYDTYAHDNTDVVNLMPGDAFFVYAGGYDNFSFTEDMQQHASSQGFRGNVTPGAEENNKKSRQGKVKFQMSDDFGTNKYLTISFSDQFTLGLDPGSDLGAFPYGESDIYSKLVKDDNGVDFTVQALPFEKITDISIPLGLKSPIGIMKLNYKENTLPEYIDMYLEDTKENTFKKITDGFEINFDEAYEGLGRFYLHFTDQLIPELPTDDNLRIYKGSDSDVMVMGAVGKNYSAKVYDYSGRLIKEVNFNHKTKINDLDSKMKILRIESEEGLTIKKFKLN